MSQRFRRITNEVETRADGDSRVLEFPLSSETPVQRFFGTEILRHTEGAVNLSWLNSGNAPLLLNHDTDKQIGVIEKAWVDTKAKKVRVSARLGESPLAEEIYKDMMDGIRKNVSVGYTVGKMEERKQDDTRVFIAVDWTPLEASVVSLPADHNVGLGRSTVDDEPETVVVDESKQAVNTISIRRQIMEHTEQDVLKMERERVAEIEMVAAQFSAKVTDMVKLRKDAVNSGMSVDAFKGLVLQRLSEDQLPTPSMVGMSEKEVRNYSIRNLIYSQVAGSGVDGTFEREVSDEIARKLNKRPQGYFIPVEIQQRDYTAGVAGQGGNLVGTNLLGGSFIDLLRKAQIGTQLGVTYMPGLVGNVAIPSLTAGATAYWISSEGGAITESSGTLGQVSLSPKSVGAMSDVTRKLLLQSTPAVDGIIMNDLSQQIACAVDTAIFHGTNASGQPCGLQFQSITSASRAGFDATGSTDLEGYVRNANFNSNNLAYATTPSLFATFKSRPLIGATYPMFLMSADGRMNGYRTVASNVISSGFVFFGDFSQVLVGEWGGLDLLVDPYTNSNTGTVRIRAFWDVDVAVRYTGAFSYAYDVN